MSRYASCEICSSMIEGIENRYLLDEDVDLAIKSPSPGTITQASERLDAYFNSRDEKIRKSKKKLKNKANMLSTVEILPNISRSGLVNRSLNKRLLVDFKTQESKTVTTIPKVNFMSKTKTNLKKPETNEEFLKEDANFITPTRPRSYYAVCAVCAVWCS